MTSQERIKAILSHKEPDRIGKYEHFWKPALAGFREQGMPADLNEEDYFDFDIRKQKFDQSFRLPIMTVEETEEYVIQRGDFGEVFKTWKHSQSTPELVDFACKSREQWFEEYRERKRPDIARLNFDEMKAAYTDARLKGKYFCMACYEVFEATWRVCGPEMQLELFIDDPEWLTDMYTVHTDLVIWAFEELWARGIEFDGLWIWGDVAYRSGPFISPGMYREFVMPHHKRLADAAHSKGCEVIYHGCGNNNKLVPLFIEAGIDCLQPMEVKAGMDVRELKRDYGDVMSFMGNIDARLFQSNDREGLEREIRDKITVAKQGGGYIYHSDHSIPPGTTLDTYRFAMECVERWGKY